MGLMINVLSEIGLLADQKLAGQFFFETKRIESILII